MRAPRITRLSRIIGVLGRFVGSRFDHIVLITPTSDLVVRCDPETDEVVISNQKRRKRSGAILATGRFRVPWTWLLINQQGYTDGFRIEIEAGGVTRVFDFVAIASAIEVREAKKTEANQSAKRTPGKGSFSAAASRTQRP